MFIEISPHNPDQRKIDQVVKILQSGGVIIYPTDTVYGIACDMTNKGAVDKLCRIRGIDPGKALLSFICKDISQVSEYTKPIGNSIYKMMKRNLPGPFTFILEANNTVPKLVAGRKKTIGVRIPDHIVVQKILEAHGQPILSISLKSDDDIVEYFTNAFEIYEEYQHLVGAVIDGGVGTLDASTIVDCTGPDPEIIREGALPLV
jgi:tRNA threonylcarbamoyl adenosine modification protein (Sua5/YciO/YrdC/YwlC family)